MFQARDVSASGPEFRPCAILPWVLLAVLCAVGAPAWGQIPAGYYDSVDTSNASALRSSLHDVIDDHTRFPYTASTTDTWDILNMADEDPNDTGSIVDLYKNASYTKISGGVGAYNREHSWPKSYGFPDNVDSNYPYTDCHHLFAADAGYNGARSNKPFRNCNGSCSEETTLFTDGRGGGSGVYPGNSNWTSGSFTQGTWETWGGRKGDVARAILYMDIRYEGGNHGGTGVAEPDLIATDNEALIDASNTGNNESVAYMGMLSVLLQWHAADPVDSREIWRNEVVYTFQGNRNPFIDHPEWVNCLYANSCSSDSTPPGAPGGLVAAAGNGSVSLSWNANSEGDLAGYNVYRGTSSGGPYSKINGTLVSNNSFDDSGLSGGTTYYYVVTAVDTSNNESPQSGQASATPSGSGGGGGSLILTEVFYDPAGADDGLEWVELYNDGSATVDLSAYSLGNGGTDYTFSVVQLSGTLAAGETFVVGGPSSNASNGNPAFDQVFNFSPDIQNSGSTADAVALFDVPASQITASTVPVDAVIYGGSNGNGLIDETGAPSTPDVGDVSSGSSIERQGLAGGWQAQANPTPGVVPFGGGGGGGGGPQSAVYDSSLGAPACATVGSSCDAGGLVNGRAGLGPEPNQPNTLDGCADGTSGTFHSDESNDGLKVSTLDGADFAAGATVRVEATVYAYSTGSSDHLDLYYAADATNPSWTLIGSLDLSSGGTQTLSADYTLPVGSLQAVRANFRYNGSVSACSTGNYDDRDDLVFAVQSSGPVNTAPLVDITSPSASSTVNQGTGVTFTATASDSEDGNVAGSLVWTSSLDGAIGSVASFSTSGLSVGSHTITASAADSEGLSASDSVSLTVQGVGGGCSVEESFTASAQGWTTSGNCSTGTFVLGVPNEIVSSGVTTQVGGDHTTGSGNALFTASNSSAGNADVDGGTCTVTSPVYSVSQASDVSVWYFFGQRDAGDDASDGFLLEMSTDGGSSWAILQSYGDVRVQAAWSEATTTAPAGSSVVFRISATDATGGGDLIEAGIDDVSICAQ